jgi:hypothetical protein
MSIDQAAPEHFLTASVLGVVGVVEDFHEGDGSKGVDLLPCHWVMKSRTFWPFSSSLSISRGSALPQ